MPPGHPSYLGASRLASARNIRRPAALARCTGVADVIAAVRFARERDIPFSVLAGGHEVDGWGLQDDVLAIDLTPMNGVLADPRTLRGTVQAGARLGIMDRETAVQGTVVPAGTVSDTGVTGLTLGGGFGWLTRKYGATIDSLIAVDAVTVDGETVRASADENPDLFWGMRGGGGNFAIATSFEFELHRQDPVVLAGTLAHSGEDAPGFLRYWRDFMTSAPDEVGAMAIVMRAKEPNFPAELKDKLVVATIFSYAGDPDKGERVLEPVRAWGKPLADTIRPMLFTDLQQVFEGPLLPQNERRTYQNSGFVPEMTDAFIDEALDIMHASPVARPGDTDVVILPISAMGGALHRFPDDGAAMPRGDAQFYWEALASHRSQADDAIWSGYVKDTITPRLRRLSGPRAYLNHNNVRPGDDEFIRWAYGPDKYQRLAALKHTWDPSNILRYNKNIKPARPHGH
ncbi:FAD-binding oxidoreductase [Streptomyces sp. NPDC054962]